MPKDKAPKEGHNSHDIGVSRDVFLSFWHRIEAQEQRVAAEQAKLKELRKQARGSGVVMGVFDRFRKLIDMTKDEVSSEFSHLLSYLEWGGANAGLQLEMFPAEVDGEGAATRSEKDVWGEGWRAGLLGKPANENVYEGDLEQAWTDGWQQGVNQRNAEVSIAPMSSEDTDDDDDGAAGEHESADAPGEDVVA